MTNETRQLPQATIICAISRTIHSFLPTTLGESTVSRGERHVTDRLKAGGHSCTFRYSYVTLFASSVRGEITDTHRLRRICNDASLPRSYCTPRIVPGAYTLYGHGVETHTDHYFYYVSRWLTSMHVEVHPRRRAIFHEKAANEQSKFRIQDIKLRI